MGVVQSTQAAETTTNTTTSGSAATSAEYYEKKMNNETVDTVDNNNDVEEEEEEEEEEESEDEDDDDDEEWKERLAILEDAKKLRQVATYFLHPEYPVEVDSTAYARCYFQPTLKDDDEEQRNMILEDMKSLKKLAQDYLEPERPIEVDPMACCRNYFTRYAGAMQQQQQEEEEEEERDQILADAKALKKLAFDYMHPEVPCVTTDPCATGRNIFTTSSLMAEQEAYEQMNEREQILADADALKKVAVDYLHPELPCITTDPCATGRNFFSSRTDEQEETLEESEERAKILEEMEQLKTLAQNYMEPNRPVTVDPLATCRNYFDRPSSAHSIQQDQMTHTYCEWVAENGYHHVIDHDHHYYWYNNKETIEHYDVDEEHHFEMDEYITSSYHIDPFKSETISGASPKTVNSKIDSSSLLSSSPTSILLLTWTPSQ